MQKAHSSAFVKRLNYVPVQSELMMPPNTAWCPLRWGSKTPGRGARHGQCFSLARMHLNAFRFAASLSCQHPPLCTSSAWNDPRWSITQYFFFLHSSKTNCNSPLLLDQMHAMVLFTHPQGLTANQPMQQFRPHSHTRENDGASILILAFMPRKRLP
jgi:hypothetical protein